MRRRLYAQNNNESLNSVVWAITPKTKFCGKHTVDFAVYTAASLFNDGYSSAFTEKKYSMS